MNSKTLTPLILLLLSAACKAPTIHIDYCELSRQINIVDMNNKYQQSNLPDKAKNTCLNIFSTSIPYCFREKNGEENILEPMLAFDKPCEGITEGRQHFILYEYRNKNGQGKKSYYLLSGFEHFDNSSSVPGQGIPAPNPILNVHFTGGGMMYGGVEESRKGSQLIVRMRKRYLFAPPCKLCFFSGNNAKPKQEENVELEVFLTAVDNGNDSFLSINKIIRHGTNSLSGNKPLLYDLEKILGDTIRMQKAYDSCQSGNICK